MRIKTLAYAFAGVALMLSAPSHALEVNKRVHGIAIHGAVKYPPNFTHFNYVNPNAPQGGTIRYGASGTYDSFNNIIPKGTSAAGIGMLYDTLLASSSDEPSSSYGALAESMRVAEDLSSVTFWIRPEARWHDGMPITAKDVKFSFDFLVSDKGSPGFAFYYSGIEKAVVNADGSITFHFKEGETNNEMPVIIGQFPVLPKHYWGPCLGKGDAEKACYGKDLSRVTLVPPLGSGPYRVAVRSTQANGTPVYDFEPGRRIAYEKVADWWGKDVPAYKGQHNFNRIVYIYYGDEAARLQAFLKGEYDIRHEYTAKVWAKDYTGSVIDNGHIKREEVDTNMPNGMQGFAFNLRRSLFKDPKVREALAYAMDFDELNSSFFFGSYKQPRSYFGNSPMEAKGLPEGDELKLLQDLASRYPHAVSPQVFTQEYNPPKVGELSRIERIIKPLKLLNAAGWHLGDDGVLRNEKGERFAFEFLIANAAFQRIALDFQANLRELGIEMSIRLVEPTQYQNRVRDFDYDMMTGLWGVSLSPGNEQLNNWSSQAAHQEGTSNVVGVQNPAIDAVLNILINAQTRDELETATRALDRLLQWGHYVVPQWYSGTDRVAYWDKFSWPTGADGKRFATYGLVDSGLWWHNPEKEKVIEAALGRSLNPAESIRFSPTFWGIFAAFLLFTFWGVRRMVKIPDGRRNR